MHLSNSPVSEVVILVPPGSALRLGEAPLSLGRPPAALTPPLALRGRAVATPPGRPTGGRGGLGSPVLRIRDPLPRALGEFGPAAGGIGPLGAWAPRGGRQRHVGGTKLGAGATALHSGTAGGMSSRDSNLRGCSLRRARFRLIHWSN